MKTIQLYHLIGIFDLTNQMISIDKQMTKYKDRTIKSDV